MIKTTNTLVEPLTALRAWLDSQTTQSFRWEAMPFDCSFRRYYRLYDLQSGQTSIAMHAPPEEETPAFVRIARALEAQGLLVPHVYAADVDAGFAWLSDLGTQSYTDVLRADNAQALYADALRALIKIHRTDLPVGCFDAKLIANELAFFQEWYLQTYAGMTITPGITGLLADTRQRLIAVIEAQPQVFLHRDYHAGNLQYSPLHNPGILDFQGALYGPITYDAVSLLKDSRLRWPESTVEPCIDFFQGQLEESGLLKPVSKDQFRRWFDYMGVELHLKILFIFTRKHCRDQQSQYLQYLPNLAFYLRSAAGRHPEFTGIAALVEEAMGAK